MTNQLLAALAALTLTACLDEAPDAGTDSPRDLPALEITPADWAIEDERRAQPERRDVPDLLRAQMVPLCQQIVETEGACAAACDEEAMRAYIPAGTCALYSCTLEDGRGVNVGGCN